MSLILANLPALFDLAWTDVVMVGLTPRWRYGVTHHLPSTLTTVEQATRKLPAAAPFARRAEVVLDVPPRSLNHLLRNLRIGDRHSYPLLSGLYSVGAVVGGLSCRAAMLL